MRELRILLVTFSAKIFVGGAVACMLAMGAFQPVVAQETGKSAHQLQYEELKNQPAEPLTEDQLEVDAARRDAEASGQAEMRGAPRSSRTAIGDDFIVFGYIQSSTQLPHTRWEALTHVASNFVEFDSSGNLTNVTSVWTNRDATMKAGGAAQNAGCKVIMTVLNSGFDVAVTNAVMTSATARTNLVNQIAAAITSDGYAAGVTFDFEPFSWTAAATAGMNTFFQQLRTALPPPYEISIYADPSPSASRWNLPGFNQSLDYFLYSCYDYGTGDSPHAISDFNNYITQINNFYIDGGVPANKIIAVISAYSRRWSGTTAYNGSATAGSAAAAGFTDALYETTLWQAFGGPKTANYVTGDEVSWHTWLDTTTATNYTRTWDSPTAMEYKIREVVSNQDPTASGTNSANKGKRLGGVGFWSLMWMAETTSINRNSLDGTLGSSVARTRTYPHIYQLCQEILKKPGTTKFLVTGFEGDDPRWRDPNANADAVNLGTTTDSEGIVNKPGGAGAPASSTKVAQVVFNFNAGATQQLFFQYEMLADPRDTTILDINAPVALFPSNTRLSAFVNTPAGYAGRVVRMVVLDANRQLEMSPGFSLGTAGWQQITWNLADAAQTSAFNTNDTRFIDGNGVIDTAGGGKKDIGFLGFLVQGGGAGAGTINFDEVTYEHANPPGEDYKINEFSYAVNDAEFVEIVGQAGSTTPAGLQARFFSSPSTTGAAYKTVALGGVTIPASGFLVLGDAGVANANVTAGFSAVVDDISNTNPSAIQLYNTTTGNVYDSVVYEANGGIGDLIRAQTLGVTGEGYPWTGEATANFALGRYPDGADTEVNFADFSAMINSPGAANGTAVAIPTTLDFSTTPSTMFQTFGTLAVSASGVGASPSGGNVYRCVDPSGGGIQAYIGSEELGSNGAGYSMSGEIYIPGTGEPIQDIAVGICGRMGSNFFTNSGTAQDSSGYETGYWLIFENRAGAGLNDQRADHADAFEFIMPKQQGEAPLLLGNASRATTGAAQGAWTTFALSVDPVNNKLIARVNGVDVYNGVIPTGGEISGAGQIGFRENHTGNPAASEGTWVDNIVIAQPLGAVPTPTATPSPSPTISLTPSPSVSPSPSPTVSLTPSPTVSLTASPTASPIPPTASPTASPTVTFAPSPTASVSPSLTATASPSPNPTPLAGEEAWLTY